MISAHRVIVILGDSLPSHPREPRLSLADKPVLVPVPRPQAMQPHRLRPVRTALQSQPHDGERSQRRRRRQIERGQLKAENGLAR